MSMITNIDQAYELEVRKNKRLQKELDSVKEQLAQLQEDYHILETIQNNKYSDDEDYYKDPFSSDFVK